MHKFSQHYNFAKLRTSNSRHDTDPLVLNSKLKRKGVPPFMSPARNICVGKKYSHEFFQHYNFAKIRTCDSSRALVPNSKGEKKAWPVPRFQCTFRLSDDTTGCAAIFASYRSHRSPSLFHSCHRCIYTYTYTYLYTHVPFHLSVSPHFRRVVSIKRTLTPMGSC